MSEPRRRLIERVIDPRFVDGLSEKALEKLRQMRDECREAENEVSFERRLCQARIDILSAELDRRMGKGSGDLLSRLPEILADGRPPRETPLSPRAPDFSIPRNADVPRRRVQEIVGEQTLMQLPQIQTGEIRGIIRSLDEHERNLSERRRRVHEVMDKIQAEIVRRYTTGEADPAASFG